MYQLTANGFVADPENIEQVGPGRVWYVIIDHLTFPRENIPFIDSLDLSAKHIVNFQYTRA